MSRGSPIRESIYELLADGQWHPVRDVVRAAAQRVPPGVAHREYRRVNPNGSASQALRIHKGQHYLVTEALRDMVVSGYLDLEGDWERVRGTTNRVRINGTFALERRQNAATLSVAEVAEQWRVTESLLRRHLRDEWIITTARLRITRIRPEVLPLLARELAMLNRRANRPVLVWLPYDMQQWALFNKVTGDWERADGALIFRKSKPEYLHGDPDVREADGAFSDGDGGAMADLV